MGLLVTLCLILFNTQKMVQGFGGGSSIYVRTWSLVCQGFIFFGILEYSFILFRMKRNQIKSKNDQETLDRIEQGFRKMDMHCLIVNLILFLCFNVVFWVSAYTGK